MEKHEGLWQKIVRKKYMRGKDIHSVKMRSSDSPWKNLLKVNDTYLRRRKISLRNGNLVRFWKDPWLHDTPLLVNYPMLFNISLVPDVTFAEVVQLNFNISFRRRFSPGMR
jgi:hypothetical protein